MTATCDTLQYFAVIARFGAGLLNARRNVFKERAGREDSEEVEAEAKESFHSANAM